MKRTLLLLILGLVTVTLAACGGEDDKLVVGATNVPHAVILEEAASLLEDEGIELEVVTFTKYELINQALVNEELDANYFQHIPYFETEQAEKDYDIANAGGIHIEPIGIYSTKYDSLEDLPDGANILISSNFPDHGRILSLFQEQGLITLKDGVDPLVAQIDDIEENPKNLEFDYDYSPELLPQIYQNGEGDAVVINSNFALDAGINPIEDSIAIEGSESPYVNIIAVRNGDEEREEIQTLVDVLHSEEIQQFILDEYSGSVVPVNE
ncbi:D-methionine transport system substrate-binding protein [Gracilibacillus halotolerans]|uniref:Lipoprotein n=1 Tax=Gracilibacillus halotolerans TaxID=74386 RepID=A0A841RL38_9BACI|nr:MetQ/NlpA family ABC transporter substrate-binding protein [Gracilibacillus halotolerans]MBB6513471.1 D-methionine transport system substrate-binding protein [Gracilibacillus halotolerans]